MTTLPVMPLASCIVCINRGKKDIACAFIDLHKKKMKYLR